jgi:thiol-disulfide isomerase/thioredoxin
MRVSVAGLLLLAVPGLSRAGLKEGDTLPPLASFGLEGMLPAKLKGQVILLDFWASWCGPCKVSFPAMEILHKRYSDRGLSIVAVSVDDNRADMERFLKENRVTFATLRDATQKLVAAADVPTMPTSFLIDRRGKVRFIHKGYEGEKTAKEYREQIELLLKEPAP